MSTMKLGDFVASLRRAFEQVAAIIADKDRCPEFLESASVTLEPENKGTPWDVHMALTTQSAEEAVTLTKLPNAEILYNDSGSEPGWAQITFDQAGLRNRKELYNYGLRDGSDFEQCEKIAPSQKRMFRIVDSEVISGEAAGQLTQAVCTALNEYFGVSASFDPEALEFRFS